MADIIGDLEQMYMIVYKKCDLLKTSESHIVAFEFEKDKAKDGSTKK